MLRINEIKSLNSNVFCSLQAFEVAKNNARTLADQQVTIHTQLEAKFTSVMTYLGTAIDTMDAQRVAEKELHLQKSQEWIEELKRYANSYLTHP